MVKSQNPEIHIVNAFSLSMLKNPRNALIEFRRISPEEARELLSGGRAVHYIRHQSTLSLIQQLAGRQLEAGGSIYEYQPGHIVIMAVLINPARGQEVETRIEDIAFYRIIVRELEME
jgi:hypothetical protein